MLAPKTILIDTFSFLNFLMLFETGRSPLLLWWSLAARRTSTARSMRSDRSQLLLHHQCRAPHLGQLLLFCSYLLPQILLPLGLILSGYSRGSGTMAQWASIGASPLNLLPHRHSIIHRLRRRHFPFATVVSEWVGSCGVEVGRQVWGHVLFCSFCWYSVALGVEFVGRVGRFRVNFEFLKW